MFLRTRTKHITLVGKLKLLWILLSICGALLSITTATYTLKANVATPTQPQHALNPQQPPEAVDRTQQNNQTFIGQTNNGNSYNSYGANQGNTGNQGINH